jgi:hypothetical protein
MPGKRLSSGAFQTLQYPINLSGTLLTGSVRVIIGMKAIEVPYRPPTAEEEKSA